MALFPGTDRPLALVMQRIAYCNPFVDERIALEREALGPDFDEREADWNRRPEMGETPGNVLRLLERAELVLDRARKALEGGARPNAAERQLYEDLVSFVLYQSNRQGFDSTVADVLEGRAGPPLGPLYEAFRARAAHYLRVLGVEPEDEELARVFALFFQIRRAFRNIFQWIVGSSQPAVHLRVQVWQSIFTHDLRRYRRVLCERMADFTTLVTGPSGTGKELVARAIGLSRFVPFDAKKKSFEHDFSVAFHSLNLSALNPTLIESELFGHKRGSFTGAVSDHTGWLDACPSTGSVFLDEIGELDVGIQVKLLRVLESRTFSRIGETTELRFLGKIIAATNRDLALEMRAGRFREDLYYRLCSDVVTTPALVTCLRDSPEELARLVSFIAGQLAGEEAAALTDDVVRWIEAELGREYAWPGNYRELEQCVRNVLVRGQYRPAASAPHPGADVAAGLQGCELSADELLRRYCTHVYYRVGSFEGAARRLGLDRRTVRSKVDAELLASLKAGGRTPLAAPEVNR